MFYVGEGATVLKVYLPNNKYCNLVTNRNPIAVAISKEVAIKPIIASFILSFRLKIPRVNSDPKIYIILIITFYKKKKHEHLTK
jgi:hypothetical protein